jgi:hypothetical protein
MFWKAILFLTVIITSVIAQFTNIKVNKINNLPNEVSIAINPKHPNNIVAGANLYNYYYSFDGGASWGNSELYSSKYGVWGDPVILFDNFGSVYYFHLSRPIDGEWIDRIVCQKSTDGGKTFNDPGSYMGLNPPKKQDKPWACADFTGGERNNYIYVCWTQFDAYNSKKTTDYSNIMFSFSSDGGTSWSNAKRINQFSGDCLDSSNTAEGAVPCVGPNGDIYVSWSLNDKIYFDRSSDGGKTWLDEDIIASDQYGGWAIEVEGLFRCNGMPVTGCDISSSPYRGNIYINFSDKRNGVNDCDIFIIKSTDGGNTWTLPLRVNDDKFQNGKQQFMSWMSIDPVSGAICIIYYDRRDYEDTQTDVYLARSTDGGETFENIKISEKPFKPIKKVFFGDYIGVASYNNFTACIWQRMDAGNLSIIFASNTFN